ncbi:putative TonB-dependent receptor [Caenibius tardaugens NBRC 16725]|uniref:Putative TonB-dependent receptor n=1 Tax=Caenibius tardaugens NBRC 16725 TaxID=1219035 RepID=U3A664_9SPHN|nr:TonB-dependent receptor [Caenibius tardaugens]AZI35047.1 TonB-dependent receptor [Caenibius tardaugens NBRC 16725]GAD50228.1 putative TonB-dependent receptor [Caenibius tardaugens NBRC 16725]
MNIAQWALAASIVAIAAPAHAESAEDADRANANVIIVNGKTVIDEAEVQVNATPGGADIVGYEDYADKSLVSLRDALAFSPGVYLQPRYGQEVRLSVRGSGLSRGYHMRGLTLLQDGVPINLADDNGDFQELEPAFFDHLEVYRGANALRFGSGTLGGAINGVTPTGADAKGLYLRGDAGSFDTWRGLASYGGMSGAMDYWGAISADTSDGDRDHARRHSLRFHGNVGFRISDAVKTRFYASLNDINQELPGALTLAQARSNPRVGNFAGDQARNIRSLRFQNRTSVALGDANLDLGLFFNRKSLDHPIFQVVDQSSLDRGAYLRLNWGSGPFAVTVGGEARFGTVDSRRYVNVNGKRGALTFLADQKARTANLYAEVRYKPLSRLSLIAGAIYADGYRDQHERYNGAVGGLRDVRARADFSELSPKFGVLYEPTDTIQIYANYSRSAELPGFGELAQISAFVPVKAQRAWTAEIGTRGTLGIAQWDVSFYRADLKGEMLQYTVGPDVPASTFNAGKTRHQGIEAALSLDLAAWLRVRQVYQYSDFRFRNDREFGGNRLPVAPKHVYRAEVRLGGDDLHIAPNIEWVPQGAWADYANTTRSGGYTLLGATAGARISRNLDVFLDARNLTGKKAVGDISAVIRATAVSAIYYPVERRALFGGIRARF